MEVTHSWNGHILKRIEKKDKFLDIFIYCFPICHHLFYVPQNVFDLPYVNFFKNYILCILMYIESCIDLLAKNGLPVKCQFVTNFLSRYTVYIDDF